MRSSEALFVGKTEPAKPLGNPLPLEFSHHETPETPSSVTESGSQQSYPTADNNPEGTPACPRLDRCLSLHSRDNRTMRGARDLDSNVYKLIYCSRSEMRGTGEEVANALLQLLDCSQSKNHRLDITGALLFYSGAFAQVLEGPQDSVEDVFSLIQLDDRHREVTVAVRGPVAERDFPGWSMAFSDWSTTSADREETGRLLTAKAAINAVFANQEGAAQQMLAVLKILC